MLRRVFEALGRLLQWLQSQVAVLLHSRHVPRRGADEEKTALISQVETSSAGEVVENVGPPKEGLVVILRHAHREDEDNSLWHYQAPRPWDPPLSQLGQKQARELAKQMWALGLDCVVTSPFLRCLQTSAHVVKALGLPEGSWQVDWGFSEVCEPRLMFAGRPELAPQPPSNALPLWMWDGTLAGEALASLAEKDPAIGSVGFPPVMTCNQAPPVYPENLASALARYDKALERLKSEYDGRRVLVVTHGEAVRQAVVSHLEGAEVYEVAHTGYVSLSRSGGEDGGACHGPWKMLESSGEHGVLFSTDM